MRLQDDLSEAGYLCSDSILQSSTVQYIAVVNNEPDFLHANEILVVTM